MLLRFIIENFMSYKEPTEFNTFPAGAKNKNHHKAENSGVEWLKVVSVYGPNGAGKSNLVKALDYLIKTVEKGHLHLTPHPFKLNKEYQADKPSKFGIEFFAMNIFYYYELEFKYGVIVTENLYRNSNRSKRTELFKRTTEEHSQKINVIVHKKFLRSEKDKLRIDIIADELLKPNDLFLSFGWENIFEEIDHAYKWITNKIMIISPTSKPRGLVMKMIKEDGFASYMKSTICALDTGIKHINVETIPADQFFGEDEKSRLETLRSKFAEKDKADFFTLRSNTGSEIVAEKQGNEILVHKLEMVHSCKSDIPNENVIFDLDEESDGTRRLFDLLPMTYGVLHSDLTFVIDEIERSIHAVLIRELLLKILDQNISGQLIFTTHESTLLDLDIFRQDEIWFVEKNEEGATTLYPLSKFKPRFDLDVRKGYLNGKFGAIPFLGNLKELNWDKI